MSFIGNLWSRIERQLRRWRDGLFGTDSDDSTNKSEFPEGTRWLHTNVSNWPVTSRLSEVRVDSQFIHMPYDKARVWASRSMNGTAVNGNPWVVFEYENQWYAATWEWLRPGQTSKLRTSLDGGHIKQNAIPANWRPSSGQKIYIFISGLARSPMRNVQERTNLVEVIWP